MAKYGSFKYGAKKYGTLDPATNLSWGLDIDWDGDGIFDGVNDGKIIDLSIRRGREFQVRKDGKGMEVVNVGEINLTLLNEDGKYDPYNTGSSIYPYVRPGMDFRLRCMDNSTGIIYNVMRGKIDDLDPSFGSQPDVIRIRGFDALDELKNRKVYIDTQQDIEYGDAVQSLLDEAGWSMPAVIEHTSDQIDYWWASGNDVLKEVNELENASFAKAFVSTSGTFNFYSRHHEYFADTVYTLTETDVQKGIRLLQPWEVVRNNARINWDKLVQAPAVSLWSLSAPIYMDGQSTLTFWVEYNYGGQRVGGIDMIQPVATTDYRANTKSDGSGSDSTSFLSAALVSFGNIGRLTLTNSKTTGIYVTGMVTGSSAGPHMQVRGTALSPNPTVAFETTDDASITLFGQRDFEVKSPWLQNHNFAKDFSLFVAGSFGDPRVYPTIRIRNDIPKQLGIDLFDSVILNFSSFSISGSYALSYIEHKWLSENGDIFETMMKFEPNTGGTVWQLDISQLDTTTILAF